MTWPEGKQMSFIKTWQRTTFFLFNSVLNIAFPLKVKSNKYRNVHFKTNETSINKCYTTEPRDLKVLCEKFFYLSINTDQA